MSQQGKRRFRGWGLAVLLGVLGCGEPGVEDPPPGDAAEAVPELAVQSEEHQGSCTERCRPAFRVEQSPLLSPYPYPDVLKPLRGKVYFVAPTAEGGPSALWRSNATGAGTYPILSNVSGRLMKAGELLYFVRNGSLWASDGTTAGSRQLKTLVGERLTGVSQEVQGRLFFVVFKEENSRRELWVSNGTPGGTRRVYSFSEEPYALSELVEFRGRLFFNAADEARGMELWVSDGTPGGTRLFKDIAPGAASSSPSQLTVACGALYFVANDQVHGQEVWTAQSLNPARTVLVRDFAPGPDGSYARLLAGLHGDLYLTLHPADQFSDLELWRTDGSARGTVLVKRFVSPNPTYTEFWSPLGLAVGGRLYFIIQPLSTMGPGVGNAQLWITDGTLSGTRYLTEPLTYGDEGPIAELFAVDGTLLFAALDNVPYDDPQQHGRELWRSRGTASTTSLLQDVLPGPDWSDPSSFARAGRYVYFLAQDASRGYRLWALPVESVRCPGPLQTPASVWSSAQETTD